MPPYPFLPPCSAPPAKAQENLERATPVTSPTLVTLARMANLGVEHGYLDPSPYNEAGAAHFVFGPPGAEQAVLVMVGEADALLACCGDS